MFIGKTAEYSFFEVFPGEKAKEVCEQNKMHICNATTKYKMKNVKKAILGIYRTTGQDKFCVNKGKKCNFFFFPIYLHGDTFCHHPGTKPYTVVCENYTNEFDNKSLQQSAETDNQNTTTAKVENVTNVENVKIRNTTQQDGSIFSVIKKFMQTHIGLTILILVLSILLLVLLVIASLMCCFGIEYVKVSVLSIFIKMVKIHK